MTTMTAPTQAIPAAPSPEALPTGTNVGMQLSGALCLLKLTVRAPAGRIQLNNFKLEATDSTNKEFIEVAKGQTTSPKWKIDQHELWGKLKANWTELTHLRNRYTVSDAIEGQYLLSMMKAGEFLNEMLKLRNERHELAEQMAAVWESEVVPAMKSKIGDEHFELHVRPKLPSPLSLIDRFDVDYCLYPLSPLTGDDLDLSQLAPRDAKQLIGEVNDRAKTMIMDRFSSIADTVMGEVLALCEEIGEGGLETGKRKSGALNEIITILERVQNFEEFASPEVLKKAEVALKAVSGITITHINTDIGNTRENIRKAFQPLASAVKKLQKQNGQVRRNFEY